MINVYLIVLLGFLGGLLTMSLYYIFKRIIKIYKYIIEGDSLF